MKAYKCDGCKQFFEGEGGHFAAPREIVQGENQDALLPWSDYITFHGTQLKILEICPACQKRIVGALAVKKDCKSPSRFMRIGEDESFIVEHDPGRDMYRVAYFEDSHFVNETFFDAVSWDLNLGGTNE